MEAPKALTISFRRSLMTALFDSYAPNLSSWRLNNNSPDWSGFSVMWLQNNFKNDQKRRLSAKLKVWLDVVGEDDSDSLILQV